MVVTTDVFVLTTGVAITLPGVLEEPHADVGLGTEGFGPQADGAAGVLEVKPELEEGQRRPCASPAAIVWPTPGVLCLPTPRGEGTKWLQALVEPRPSSPWASIAL